jgi:aerobic C4-dicarboxylate transport protein
VGHVPVAGLALILGIDRFMSEARALTNLVGNGVASIVVAKWTGDLDNVRLQQVLNKETSAQADEPEAVLGQVDAHQAIAHQPDTARPAH